MPEMSLSASRSTNWFVWSTWCVLIIAAVFYVASYGSNVPSWDDWDMVPTMTQQQPITLEWLWSQHNEHRVPLSRLVMLAMYRLWPDFRICMYLNVLMMAVMSGVLIRCAQSVRGRVAATDVFFPLVLLGFAQGLNFIWAWQVEFFTSTVIALFVLVLIAGYRDTKQIKTAALASVGLSLLVVCGAHGLALVPVLALWIAVIALFGFSEGSVPGRARLILLALTVIVFGLVALYFRGYQRVPYFPVSRTARHTVNTALQFLTMAFGPPVQRSWPISGFVTGLMLALAGMLAAAAAWRQRAERVRALGFLLFLGAMCSLGLAVGLGRNGFEPRYITLSVPVLCCAYFVFVVYAPARLSRIACTGLLAIALLCLLPNFQSGLKYGRELHEKLASFEAEMRIGTPPYELIHKYMPFLHPNTQILDDYLPLLRQAGIGQFRYLRDNPRFKEIPVPLTPIEVSNCNWEGGTGRTLSGDARIVFAVPQTVSAAGILVRYNVKNGRGTPPFFSILWRNSYASKSAEENKYYVSPTGDRANWERGTWLRIGRRESELILWVCGQVREIVIQPDAQACVFTISKLVLLQPEVSSPNPPRTAVLIPKPF